MQEPGLDRHEWETEWQATRAARRGLSRRGLPELDDLVERMMVERGYPVDGTELHEAPEPEIVPSSSRRDG